MSSPCHLLLCATIGVVAVVSPSSFANQLHVPADYPTIKAAVQAANDGDEVLVAPGVYPETFSVLGKAIAIRSTGGPSVTTIDGRQERYCVRIGADEGPDTILEGFTLTNGAGWGTSTGIFGGALIVLGTSPTIRGNVFVGNTAEYGGAVYVDPGSSPIFEGNTFEGNSAILGGVMYILESRLTIEGNEFLENSVPDEGGALWMYDCGGSTVANNRFLDNTTTFGPYGPRGGGIYAFFTSNALFEGNYFEGNRAGKGAGIYLHNSRSDIRRCTFVANESYGAGGAVTFDTSGGAFEQNVVSDGTAGIGGGVAVDSFSYPDIIGNVIVNNDASAGGGLWIRYDDIVLERNTIANNTAALGGGIFAEGDFSLRHSILWGNTAAEGPQLALGILADAILTYSNIQGGEADFDLDSGATYSWGAGMIDQDPLFADPAQLDFTLTASSPCVDAGDPAENGGDLDILDTPDRLDGNLDRELIVDMGAYEFAHGRVDWTGTPAPGGSITLDLTGTPGHSTFLFYSIGSLESSLGRFGPLYINFGFIWGVASVGAPPVQVSGDIPPDVPTPITLTFQTLSVDTSTDNGTTSNVVFLPIE